MTIPAVPCAHLPVRVMRQPGSRVILRRPIDLSGWSRIAEDLIHRADGYRPNPSDMSGSTRYHSTPQEEPHGHAPITRRRMSCPDPVRRRRTCLPLPLDDYPLADGECMPHLVIGGDLGDPRVFSRLKVHREVGGLPGRHHLRTAEKDPRCRRD
jgi:hypothetical protein